MSEQDPKRLRDGGADSGELRSLLEAGRGELPSDAQMLMLASKLAILGALGGAGAAGAAGASGAGAAGASGAGAAGASGAGAAGASGAGAATAAGAAAKGGLLLKVVGAAAVALAAGTGAVVATSRPDAPSPPIGLVATPSARVAEALEPSAAPAERASASETASARPTNELPTPSSRVAPSARASAVSPAPSSLSDGPDEIKVVERAQDALRSSRPAEALALCNDHVKRFPAGTFVQEREVIAVEALVKVGRKDEARARADRFKARFPGSSHTRRLESLLAN